MVLNTNLRCLSQIPPIIGCFTDPLLWANKLPWTTPILLIMEVQTVSSRTYGFMVLYDMHTTFFPNVIVDISEKDACERLGTKANHMAWLAGSLVQERFELARSFGINKQQQAHELFKDHKGIQEGVQYPALQAFEQDWKIISPLLRKALLEADDEKLDEPFEMPGMKMTLFELISFQIYREANCIGQLALWRRLLGYPAMKYM